MRTVSLLAGALLTGLAVAQRNFTIDYWKDSQYRGEHVTRTFPLDQCADLPGGWNDAISSAKIGYGCVCYFFRDAGCRDYAPYDLKKTIIGPQSVPDFVALDFNDQASSIKCSSYYSPYCNTVPPPADCANRCAY
ncbi:hypothetical protein F5Y17DRAFT_458072 [Xylariaceae sp. FL0594]|nr:hypothetical protein F5Y17DRAFT_458072 [Xylariaceae sp. FL0594]